MDEQDNAGTQGDDAFANGADQAPAAGLISQYVKDLSFENPNAPAIYQNETSPEINVQFDIGANQVGEEVHEVVLKIEVRATSNGQTAFITELSYAGLFGLRNIPAEHVQPFLLGEGPRLLFPFARRVVADAIRDGGFPPLVLEPIDFNALFLQQAQQQGIQFGDGQVGHA
ncbi:protein-export chaperone SecB [Sphingomonas sp.]|uniref:protein-export chaperone SecB n=1 Tax=Sphingomonas sp. TaxID=28214 RepID=UPI0035C7F67C